MTLNQLSINALLLVGSFQIDDMMILKLCCYFVLVSLLCLFSSLCCWCLMFDMCEDRCYGWCCGLIIFYHSSCFCSTVIITNRIYFRIINLREDGSFHLFTRNAKKNNNGGKMERSETPLMRHFSTNENIFPLINCILQLNLIVFA